MRPGESDNLTLSHSVDLQLRRDIRLKQIRKNITEIQEKAEPEFTQASIEGLSLLEWKMSNKLRMNENKRKELQSESCRLHLLNMASPLELQRRKLLNVYLNKVTNNLSLKN